MHRIDTGGSVNGLFSEGSHQNGVEKEATILSADWLNDVQENLCLVIEKANVKLEKKKADQLFSAIQTLVSIWMKAFVEQKMAEIRAFVDPKFVDIDRRINDIVGKTINDIVGKTNERFVWTEGALNKRFAFIESQISNKKQSDIKYGGK